MKINSAQLKAAMTAADTDAEALANAIVPEVATAKQRKEKTSAVRNWTAGKDHPRCSAADVTAIAGVLGVRATDIALFENKARFVRSSPQKARLVADLIRGRNVSDALDLLEFSPKRAAVFVRKSLDAAVADAEAQGASIDSLVVSESRVDEGPIIKRFQPKDRGRAHPIQKKTSHITVSVQEVL